MNAAMTYIEANLDGEIDHDELARIACCSAHNFFRIFSIITEVSLAEYVRRRRLTLAALALQNSDVKVVEVAVRYGYDSPVSFARAFQALHGVTPSEARTDGVMLKAYPKMSFQLSIKGEKEMDYRIESKEAFQVFGIEDVFDVRVGLVNAESDESLRKPADLWDECRANGAYEKLYDDAGDLPAFIGKDLCNVHAVCDYRESGKGTFPYMLCAIRNANSKTDGYVVANIPAHTWAIFPSIKCSWNEFGDVIGALYKRIYTEWMPASNYEQVGSLDMEIYGGDEDTGYVEIWVAVKKKVN